MLPSDADARAYVLAVNTADGQPLEAPVVQAIDAFVVGCKADGIWSAIKASCLLMGARTLSGALTPLVGSAPTNNGPFVSGDYNRKTGLLGDGVAKYLDANRNTNADPQDNFHHSVFCSVPGTAQNAYIGSGAGDPGATQISIGTNLQGAVFGFRNRNSTPDQDEGASYLQSNAAGKLIGSSRSAAGEYSRCFGALVELVSRASETPHNGNQIVFGRNSGTNVAGNFTNARLAFYSVGTSLSLSLLNSRVSTLYNAIGAAIP